MKIPSGVPQGSHLGPLFYNIYLFDIYKCFEHSKFLMYADDTKIFLEVNHFDECTKLQHDLNQLSMYYKTNRININAKKCQTISFTRKRNPVTYNYNIQGIIIERVNVVRDLGVYFDSKLIMNEHIDHITHRAYKSLGFVQRVTQPFTDLLCTKNVYNAYVRSILDYASSIWFPQYITYSEKIEIIQKKFIRYLNYKSRSCFDSYEEGCRYFRLPTLASRRVSTDMMLLFDIVRGNLDCPSLVSELGLRAARHRSRNPQLFHIPSHRTKFTHNSVLTRIARTYNVSFSSVDIFDTSRAKFKSEIIKILDSGGLAG